MALRPTLVRPINSSSSSNTNITTTSSTSMSKSVKRQNVERLRESVSNLLTSVLPSRVANDPSYYDKVFRIAYGISAAFLKEEPGGISGAIMTDEQIATAARHSHYAVKAVVPLYHRFLSDDDNEDEEDEEDEIMDSLSSSLGGSRTGHSGGIGSEGRSGGNMNLGTFLSGESRGIASSTTMRLGDFVRDKDEENINHHDDDVDDDDDDDDNNDDVNQQQDHFHNDRQKRLAQRRAEYLRPNRTAMSTSMMRTPQSTQDYLLG